MSEARRRDWAKGALDLHVHAAPSLFERWGDAWDLAEACEAAGMAGFVLKSHRMSTVETAAHLRPRFPSLKIFGGLALNAFVGGVNPIAVDAQLRVGARIFWLPTIHSAHHGEKCGCLGGFHFQKPNTPQSGPKVEPLRVVDDSGALTPSMKDVLHLLDRSPAALASGHVSPEEIFSIQRYIAIEKLEIRFVINHVQFTVPALTLRQLGELQSGSTWFETVQLCISPLVGCATPKDIAGQLASLPDAQWILASDSGQRANLKSPDALHQLASALASEGVDETRLERMMRDEPLRLLGEA